MKLSDKDDIEVLSYYEDFNKVFDKDNNLPFMLHLFSIKMPI